MYVYTSHTYIKRIFHKFPPNALTKYQRKYIQERSQKKKIIFFCVFNNITYVKNYIFNFNYMQMTRTAAGSYI